MGINIRHRMETPIGGTSLFTLFGVLSLLSEFSACGRKRTLTRMPVLATYCRAGLTRFGRGWTVGGTSTSTETGTGCADLQRIGDQCGRLPSIDLT